MKIKTIIISILLCILFQDCNSQESKFNFNGRKVLYSSKSERSIELILLNIDTNEELKIRDFDEIERSSFLLFNNGKSIVINSYNSTGYLYVYDIVKDVLIEIDIHEKNKKITGFIDASIYNDTLFFASENKIFAHSLTNFNLVKEYTTDSSISQFAVYNKNKIAVTHYLVEEETLFLSEIFLYNFMDDTKKKIPSGGNLLKWSKDKKYLMFLAGLFNPTIMEYPSYKMQVLNGFEKDSITYFKEMFFIDNSSIIFSGKPLDGIKYITNLYLYDIETNTVTKHCTNTKTEKEIKSTCY